jgi:hypothetical protein
MMHLVKRALPVIALLAAASAPAQIYTYFHDHGGSVSVGATGNFATPLTTNPQPQTFNTVSNGATLTNTISNQQQYISSSPGLLTSLQFHPVPWAGVEVNYGYQHYSEFFAYNVNGNPALLNSRVKTTTHEATAAYQFHPKHIPFGPFVNVGGGAIDFVPTQGGGTSQWRGAGLVETGFEINMPYTQKRLALRLQARGLFYRAPNFNSPLVSTRSWRVSSEPSASFVYRF